MSEYQYYEFCNIHAPLTTDARKEMYSLSCRASVTTHGASYVYNYGDFRGNANALVLKYFDVFFYISNWGCIRLLFKFSTQDISIDTLKKYCIEHIIHCVVQDSHILLDINFSNEEGFGWVEGEGILPDLLPIYHEIKSGNYQFLSLVAVASHKHTTLLEDDAGLALSQAQEAFFKYAGIDHKKFYA